MAGQRLGLPASRACLHIFLAALILSSIFAAAQSKKAPKGAQKASAAAVTCSPTNTVTANVVALDQPYMLNRLGSAMPQGMIFALQSDVVSTSNFQSCSQVACTNGQVQLRSDKRPRPIVLRVNQGQCLKLNFTNLLAGSPTSPFQPVTRQTSIHVNGMELVSSIADDGSYVGQNNSSLVTPSAPPPPTPPAGKTTYTLYAAEQGTFLLYSMGAPFGSGAEAGQITDGLFGAVTVEPPQAEYYRSQVTRDELVQAIDRTKGNNGFTPDGHPIINYAARYPPNTKINNIDWSCKPVLAMVSTLYQANGSTCAPTLGGMLQTYYTDLTAIITGPKAGRFPNTESGPEFNPVPASPDRRQPYREFTIHYHEVTAAVQPFSDFYKNSDGTPGLSVMLQPGQDNFAINYGTGAIGTEILANRLQVGPMWQCEECKFEEFFLVAWAVGDPAMVVNKAANFYTGESPVTNPNGPPPDVVQKMENYAAWAAGLTKPAPPLPPPPQQFAKATQAFFPDDPSNVYHSYLQDHVKFRILHGGSNLTHIHHQHAHQWLHTPNDPNSSYLDSQLISPGSAYTLEIDYNGGGNRNQTLGDSIFHCHFYPHFAAGMWSLWRVHDVFEAGTQLQNGIPVQGARALPDGEIASGTPIPAVVPLPTIAMAPNPAKVQIVPVPDPKNTTGTVKIDGYEAKVINKCDRMDGKDDGTCTNPGFPFFVPGVAGHRAPAPPLDFAPALTAGGQPIIGPDGKPEYLDGGLNRHVILSGTVTGERHNQWDFSKDDDTLVARELPELGTTVEKAAMAYNGVRQHPSYTPAGQPGSFITNGLPRGPQPGAPFADPAVDDQGKATGEVRRYKAADIQTDVVFNKVGWHYPQERFITLWSDVKNTLAGARAPEPFFFRANSKTDVVEFWQTNLVPSYYELDDFQVRTPTDIIGQHIHLVKFDVLASDGASNGFNYEDGTLSPNEVVDRINAIRKENNCTPNDSRNGTFECPVAKDPTAANGYPIDFGPPPAGQNWKGAQTTIQRWYADPLDGCFWPPCPNNGAGKDRTLRTVFTHDHFGPSTHQQAGLYAGLVVEPEKSQWKNSETGQPLGGGSDGGPTSWQANIVTNNQADSYREFLLEFQDLALTYANNSIGAAVAYPSNPPQTITNSTPPWGWMDCNNQTGDTTAINSPPAVNNGLNCAPTIISGGVTQGTMTVNYRNEPLPLRVCNGTSTSDCSSSPDQGDKSTDLSYVYSSTVPRKVQILNTQPTSQPIDGTNNSFQYPPPLLSCPNGTPGCTQGGDPYTPLLRTFQGDRVQVRVLVGAYLFNHNFSVEGLKWLFEPSSSTSGYRDNQPMGISEHFEYQFTAPTTKGKTADYLYMPGSGVNDQGQGLWGILRSYNAGGNPSSVPSLQPLPNNMGGGVTLKASASCPSNATGNRTYYVAAQYFPNGLTYNSRDGSSTSITNQNGALVYVMSDASGKTSSTPPKEPLVLRAAAGECITVHLFNTVDPTASVFTTADGNAPGNLPFSQVSLFPSSDVGMHAQLVSYDVTENNGVNVGLNPDQVACPPSTTGTAGCPSSRTYTWYAGQVVANPDGTTTGIPIELGSANLITADPLEQQPLSMIGALIVEPKGSSWPANSGTSAMIRKAEGGYFRDFVAMLQNNVYLTQNAFNAINFGTEPMSYRFMNSKGKSPGNFDQVQVGNAFSNRMPNSFFSPAKLQGQPQTPIFCAMRGEAVRFRMLHPDGLGGFPDDVWTIHGHVWPEEPYVTVGNVPSAAMGNNPNSQWFGARDGFGTQNHFDILLSSAGGKNRIAGDYLYRSFPVGEFTAGNWGVFRVNATVMLQRNCERGLYPALLAAPEKVVTPLEQVVPRVDTEERFENRKPHEKSRRQLKKPQ